MSQPPDVDVVYLVAIDGEWPVSAIAADHPSTPARVEAEVKRRTSGANPPRSTAHAHVWMAHMADLVEIEPIPARKTEPELRVKL